ncbi:MAG TPA: M56 family metallopeptidase [Dongiaceae bacterium]|nr:M56 family metallopeptidase [Dongiaceae bacterium]
MNSVIEKMVGLGPVGGLIEMVAWRSLALLALVWLALWCWRRSPAAGRHLVWTMTFVCLLSLPVLLPCLPKWQSPLVIPADTWNNRIPDQLKFMLGDFAPETVTPPPGEAVTGTAVAAATPTKNPVAAMGLTWQSGLTMIWLAGLVLFGLRLVVVQFRLAQLARRLPECEQPKLREALEALWAQYDIRHPVKLLFCSAATSPMTWGYRRPVIVLAPEALAWPEERLRVVLRHELAHIRRCDWLTQELAQLACAFYWFNPLVWLAARQMRVEREKACDDYVLNSGTQPTEYATHLVEIARQFAGPAQLTGTVAMARPSGLEQRIHAILDDLRQRRAPGRKALVAISGTVLSAGLLIAGCSNEHKPQTWSLERSKVAAQYKSFVVEKTAQAVAATDATETEGGKMPPEFNAYFAAAARGDWPTVKKMFEDFEKHAPQYTHPGQKDDPRLHGTAWEAVKETWGVLYALAESGEKYSAAFAQGIIDSIPPGSVYFGGTDPGRFLVTGMEKSQIQGDPFFLITQNALADGTYMDYVRHMYGEKLHLPTETETKQCFTDYTADAKHRLDTHQLKPGEDVTLVVGQVQVSGQVAVMAINGLIAKLIFDTNPDREFYIEESFPLDWMYPYLEPHGLIMKVNRQPLGQMPDSVVQTDQDYWAKETRPMIGDWLREDTSVAEVVAFVKKTCIQHDYSGFTGDRAFLESADAQKMFSKLRSSIAGVYAWRAEHTQDAGERDRMNRAADFAFREAYALCPYSPETLSRYTTLLVKQNRKAEALTLAETAATLDPKSTQIPGLIAQLKRP